MGVIALPILGFSVWIIDLHYHVNRPTPEEAILPLIPSCISILESISLLFGHKLYKSDSGRKWVYNIIIRGPTRIFGIFLPAFYFIFYFACVVRLSTSGNFRDGAEKNELYLKLKEIGDILRSGTGSVPGEDHMRGAVVSLAGFVVFELVAAILLCLAGMCTVIWGKGFWPRVMLVQEPDEEAQ
ncbi:hypothetical protein FPQ18DRAFT_394101 [Pyronema domesticum]|nr:hypothetical protein FPQ18DRAFT_394101 [Pyronema domesticum]